MTTSTDNAWRKFRKTEMGDVNARDVSLQGKLDTIAAQLNKIEIDTSRVADTVPDLLADEELQATLDDEQELPEAPDTSVLDDEGEGEGGELDAEADVPTETEDAEKGESDVGTPVGDDSAEAPVGAEDEEEDDPESIFTDGDESENDDGEVPELDEDDDDGAETEKSEETAVAEPAESVEDEVAEDVETNNPVEEDEDVVYIDTEGNPVDENGNPLDDVIYVDEDGNPIGVETMKKMLIRKDGEVPIAESDDGEKKKVVVVDTPKEGADVEKPAEEKPVEPKTEAETPVEKNEGAVTAGTSGIANPKFDEEESEHIECDDECEGEDCLDDVDDAEEAVTPESVAKSLNRILKAIDEAITEAEEVGDNEKVEALTEQAEHAIKLSESVRKYGVGPEQQVTDEKTGKKRPGRTGTGQRRENSRRSKRGYKDRHWAQEAKEKRDKRKAAGGHSNEIVYPKTRSNPPGRGTTPKERGMALRSKNKLLGKDKQKVGDSLQSQDKKNHSKMHSKKSMLAESIRQSVRSEPVALNNARPARKHIATLNEVRTHARPVVKATANGEIVRPNAAVRKSVSAPFGAKDVSSVTKSDWEDYAAFKKSRSL